MQLHHGGVYCGPCFLGCLQVKYHAIVSRFSFERYFMIWHSMTLDAYPPLTLPHEIQCSRLWKSKANHFASVSRDSIRPAVCGVGPALHSYPLPRGGGPLKARRKARGERSNAGGKGGW